MASIASKVASAISTWASTAFTRVWKDVETNLTGRVLQKRSGKLLTDVRSANHVTKNGFVLGTSLPYGKAWEHGFTRRAYDVFPVKRKALHFFIGRDEIFAKHVHIPRQYFKAKPFLRPAVNVNKVWMKGELTKGLLAALQGTGARLNIRVSLK